MTQALLVCEIGAREAVIGTLADLPFPSNRADNNSRHVKGIGQEAKSYRCTSQAVHSARRLDGYVHVVRVSMSFRLCRTCRLTRLYSRTQRRQAFHKTLNKTCMDEDCAGKTKLNFTCTLGPNILYIPLGTFRISTIVDYPHRFGLSYNEVRDRGKSLDLRT